MKCPNCNTELPDTAKMCYSCKQPIRLNDSEGDTSKICPNCGISLPLTASMCYCCKYVFNSTGTLSMPARFNNQTGTLTNNYQSRFSTVDRGYNDQRRSSAGGANSSTEQLRKNAMVVCLIGSIICGIATFMPYIGVNIFGTTISVSIMDNIEYGIENLFWVMMSLIFCTPRKQKSGAGHIILGLLGLAGCIFNSVRISGGLKDEYSSLISMQVGFYALLIGSIMVLASGIMMNIAHKKE